MRLRYNDLKARGIVNNRGKNWIKNEGFPPGQMTGPNTRTWDDESEVNPWLDSRPTTPKSVPRSPGRPRKAETRVTKVQVDSDGAAAVEHSVIADDLLRAAEKRLLDLCRRRGLHIATE